MRPLRFLPLVILVVACGGDADSSPALRAGDELVATVGIPSGSGPGLRHAAEDLVVAMAAVADVPVPDDVWAAGLVVEGVGNVTVRFDLAEADAGEEGFALSSTSGGVDVQAATEAGAAYGLYTIASDLGAFWIHPEEDVRAATDPEAELPRDYHAVVDQPRFGRRGFHEHTQHPIPASDFLLVAESGDEDLDYRAMSSRYVRWLARNRQNVMSMHLMRTVDLATWAPYMESIVAEAHEHFVEVGAVVGFVDEQQNAFRLIRDEDERDSATQIAERLDSILEGGLDFVTLQFGASEFTKPADDDVLRWFAEALAHVETNHEDVRLGSWIHINCGLAAEDGGLFFHLPEQLDSAYRAWVHTTMYYDLEHPAPVYECENFHHQREYLSRNEEAARMGGQELEFFPETAWWLGFDNNVPLAMPITGWSRAWDIQNELSDAVTGHVTFTTGREWGYWRYDHHLTLATWDESVGWEDYLARIAPLFDTTSSPERGAAVVSALTAFTERQVQDFYEDHPELYFYVSGELPQDEAGERIGILARRPKPSYRSIADLDDDAFAAWEREALEPLRAMAIAYGDIVADLPPPAEDETLPADMLYGELYDTLALFVLRIQQAVALYEGVVEVRAGMAAIAAEDMEETAARRVAARAKLAESRDRINEARTYLLHGVARYRYPADLVRNAKPESLTIYPFGYLRDAQNAYFWTRRSDQLQTFINARFSAADEMWLGGEPASVFYADPASFEITTPNDPVAAEAIRGLLPGLLFGTPATPEDGPLEVLVAEDTNNNGLPDPMTEQTFAGALSTSEGDASWDGTPAPYSVLVFDDTGAVALTLPVVDMNIDLAGSRNVSGLLEIATGSLDGQFQSGMLVDAVMDYTGSDLESTEILIKQVYGVDSGEPLPELLPLAGTFETIFLAQ